MSAALEARVHPGAQVDPGARLAPGVAVGPFAVVGAGVEVGEGTEIGAGAQLLGPARLGRDNRVFPYACLGFAPQDLKYGGEPTRLEVGDRNTFRELCTVHRGTVGGGGVTTIGSDNLFMAYTHVAHDCHVGDRTIFANNATLAGHVEVHDDATISAFTSVHQFCRVGRHAYVGGYSVVVMDVLPYSKTVGGKPAFYGANPIGMRRKGMSDEEVARIERALDILTRAKLTTARALEQMREELGGHPEVDYLIQFVASAKRGVHKSLPGRKGGRGGGE